VRRKRNGRNGANGANGPWRPAVAPDGVHLGLRKRGQAGRRPAPVAVKRSTRSPGKSQTTESGC
jgi:hypothetical protein